MDPSELDSIHERASGHYLQGEFEEARKAWQSLLEIVPDDERALEGLRQCGLMTAAEPGSVEESAGDRPFSFDPMAGSAPPVGDGDPDDEPIDLGVLEDDPAAEPPEIPLTDQDEMESMLIDHDEEPVAAEPPPVPADVPSPDRQGDGIDLGAVDEMLDLGSDPQPPATAGSEADADASAVPPPLPSQEPETGPQTDPGLIQDEGAAESELRLRVQELMLEARTAADENRPEDALAVLDRLFILEEDHAEARELEGQLREDNQQKFLALDDRVAEGVQLLGYDQPDQAAVIFREILEQVPDHEEARHYLAEAESRASGDVPDIPLDAEDEAMPLGDLGADDAGLTGADAHDAVADHGSISLPESGGDDIELGPRPEKFEPLDGIEDFPETEDGALSAREVEEQPAARKGPNKVLVGIAAALVVAAGLYAARSFLPGSSETSETTTEGTEVTAPAGTVEGTAGDSVVPAVDGERSTEELIRRADELAGAVIVDMPDDKAREKLAELFVEADAAMEAGDFAAAILVYNRALKIRPDDPQAVSGLRDAGDHYREQQAQFAEIERARRAIQDGDYTAGLRILYRLPRDLAPDTVRELKVAGWYNLGVMELRGGDVDVALTHFQECLALDPDDEAVLHAKETAEELAGAGNRRNYYAVVERIPFRDVES